MKIEFTEAEVKIMQAALDRWSGNMQIGCLVEECAELIVALQKHANRNKPNMIENILEEMADVEIMLAQVRLHLGIDDDTLRKQIEYKFERANQYLTRDEV
ncbi:MAG: hypothetical protein FWB88_01120 [Defluviitaleaceae bacterium]|nr:hypothetical protein [Defluviitaleaceae bacterium]MCL2238398.1 hypothetical protein [Defluviitaleaceae bacterium]